MSKIPSEELKQLEQLVTDLSAKRAATYHEAHAKREAASDNLESIHDSDYYHAFFALAQTFQEEPAPTPDETASI